MTLLAVAVLASALLAACDDSDAPTDVGVPARRSNAPAAQQEKSAAPAPAPLAAWVNPAAPS